MKLTPAEYVIQLFGGIRPLARALNTSPSTVWAWRTNFSREDGRGTVPAHVQRTLLEIAKQKKLDLTAEDLILGRSVSIKKGKNGKEKKV